MEQDLTQRCTIHAILVCIVHLFTRYSRNKCTSAHSNELCTINLFMEKDISPFFRGLRQNKSERFN